MENLSDELKSGLERNFAEVRARLEAASGGAVNGNVVLEAATKTVSAEVINYCAEHLGLAVIGENRVQELLEKYDALRRDLLEIHFIGSLQTNKVKYIIDKVDMIESLDSLPLAREIDRRAWEHGIIMPVLVEINIAEEASKGGVLPRDIPEFLGRLGGFPNILVKGFMTMAKKCEKSEEYLQYFSFARKIYLDNSNKKCDNICMSILSMGMSDSYAEAVACGATVVRVGTALFGVRINH